MKCDDCGEQLPLKVCHSAAGYYIGWFCPNCGPYGRDSVEYYRTHEVATRAMTTETYTRRDHP